MTVVPEDPRHVHDRRYSQLDHRHRDLESQIAGKADADHTHPGKVTGEWSYSTNTTIADPGRDQAVISDAMLLAALQAAAPAEG